MAMARLRVVLASAAVLVLGLAIPMKASAFDYAPINCSKAGSAAEVAVCRTYSLGQAEARMSTLYGIATALVAMGHRSARTFLSRPSARRAEGPSAGVLRCQEFAGTADRAHPGRQCSAPGAAPA